MARCRNCGAFVTAEAAFCPECGNRMPPKQEPSVRPKANGILYKE